MKTALRTDVGRIRSVNEDRVLVESGARYTLAVVADGMGGHKAGDIASQIAVETIADHLRPAMDGSVAELQALMNEAVHRANEKVHTLSATERQYEGMGTTVVAALVDNRRIVLSHIGDSRAYLWHDGSLSQLTQDHSYVNELVRQGQLSADEANHHPQRNVLTRALGTEPHVQAETAEFEWEEGDMLLLCTDGLNGLLPVERIAELLGESGELPEKANRLIENALAAGGDDNVTVVLVSNDNRTGGETE